PRSTVPIRARGHVVPHQQAAHMTATGRLCTRVKKLLRAGGHPHMTLKRPSLRGAAGDKAISMVKDQSAGRAVTATARSAADSPASSERAVKPVAGRAFWD